MLELGKRFKMRFGRYLYAVFWAALCLLFSTGSLILQGCSESPPPPVETPPASAEVSEKTTQVLAEIYAGLDAKYPDGMPKPLSVAERHADPTYTETLNKMTLERNRLTQNLASAKAEAESFAKVLITSQNERLKKAGYDPMNATLEAKLLEDSTSYQTLLSKQLEAEAALAEHMRAIQNEIARRSNAPIAAYKAKLSEADAAAQAAGLPTRAEWQAEQSKASTVK
jgi:hypothetical protein